MAKIEFTAEIAAAILAYENASTLTERMQAFGALEQLGNTERLNGRFDVAQAIHVELMRIRSDTRVMDALDAASPFSKANWAKAGLPVARQVEIAHLREQFNGDQRDTDSLQVQIDALLSHTETVEAAA